MSDSQLNLRIDPKLVDDLSEYCRIFGRHKTKTVEDWIKLGIILETNPILKVELEKIVREQNYDLKIKIPDITTILTENYETLKQKVIDPIIQEKLESRSHRTY